MFQILMRLRRVASCTMLVLLVILGDQSLVPRVNGQRVGLVCLAGPLSNDCPSTPLAISTVSGTQLQIAVNIQGSDAMNGFDIFVKADPTILRGVTVDLSGSVLGPSIFAAAECIDLGGFGCGAGQNGVGVVRVAAVALAFTTPAPISGRLFSITYNATGNSSPVYVGFQAGCSGTSVAPNFCVTVVNAGIIDQEALQGSTGLSGDFSISVNFCCTTLLRNTVTFGSLTLKSVDGFFGSMSLTISVSPVRRFGPTAYFFSSQHVFLEPGTFTTMLWVVVIYPTTPAETFTVTLSATSGTISHSGSITFRVTPH